MTFPARLTELLEKATKGPWNYHGQRTSGKSLGRMFLRGPNKHALAIARICQTINQESDAEFICYLVNHAEAIRDLVVAAENVLAVSNMVADEEIELEKALAKLEE